MPLVWSLCDVALIHLKDSHVFAEVIPSKIFEAMAMGLPLLAAVPEGEATHIVRETGAGLCVPAEDPAALAGAARRLAGDADTCRSEEHTSELQSLMRISYAVFCLKKKNKKQEE